MTDQHVAEGAASNARPSAGDTRHGRRASVQWASTIKPKRQIWLWDRRIPMGTVSALAGRGGTGKTTYAVHMIAQLSTGTLPGKFYGDPRPALIWSGEDEWDKVIVPRLIAAGADLERVGRLGIDTDIDGQTREATPRLPLDTAAICDTVIDTGAVLVLIDPIASTMTGDLNREADVRAALDALARVGSDTGAVMMFVRHFGKGGGNASDKMSGNHAFRDAVRSVFLFATDEDRVIVTQDKGNYAPPGDESFAFQLENVSIPTEDGPADVARVVDLGSSDTSVGDVINRAERDDDDSDRTAAEHWLQDYLIANGATPSKVIKSDARKEGFSEATLKRAKKKIGAVDRSEGFPRTSIWDLPSQLTDGQASDSREPTEPTEPTGLDLHKQNEPTEPSTQLAHVSVSEPTGDPTETPTPLDARRQGLTTRRTVTFRGQQMPRCYICGKAVVAGQGDVHLSCASKQKDAS